MTRDDVDPAVTAILTDHWGDRRAWFEFTLGNAACHSIVADADGEVIGTGVATVNGPVAWIGTIWVARDHRRRGLGAALTDAVADMATAEGATTLLLVATDRGRPLYERSGFEVQTWYRTFEAPESDETGGEGRLAPTRPSAAAAASPTATPLEQTPNYPPARPATGPSTTTGGPTASICPDSA